MGIERGYIHVFTGDGKGKTTAALGMCLRASGHGLRCLVIQFMKGNIEYGEVMASRRLPLDLIDIRQMGREVSSEGGTMVPEQIDMKWAQDALRLARKTFEKGSHDVLVLDEVVTALANGLIHVDDLLAVLDRRPENIEVILTGAGAPPEILAVAHVVTEMRKIKHYADIGVGPRSGIEH